jgi:hypothetical protein
MRCRLILPPTLFFCGCSGPVQNNTTSGNSAAHGGALYARYGTIRNCVIWANVAAGSGNQIDECVAPCFSCTQDWPGGGERNTAEEPRFSDPASSDCRLEADSPCIDAGDHSSLNPPGLDLDGHLRIAFGRTSLAVDMGAYEHNSVSFQARHVRIEESVNLRLAWNSRPGDSYRIWSSPDLSKDLWIPRAAIPSDGEFASWADEASSADRRFYRIEMEH